MKIKNECPKPLLTNNETLFVSVKRSVKHNGFLTEISKAMHGVPTLKAAVNGNVHYLPLRTPNGDSFPEELISALDFKYWNELEWLLPRELDNLNDLHNLAHVLLGINGALKYQQDWLQTERDLVE